MNHLILRLSALGDVIHTIPAVVALRDELGADRLTWLVEQPYRELVESVAGVRTIAIQTRRWRRDPFSAATRGEVKAMRRAVRAFAYDGVSVDFQGLVKSAFLGRLSGARIRYGFDARAIREKAALLFITDPVRVDPLAHVVEQNLALARAVGATATVPAAIDFTPFLSHMTEALEPYFDRIVLLPASGKVSKNWPEERFRELAVGLAAQFDTKPLVVWGPGEGELAERIAAGGIADVGPATTLRELALLLAKARLVVGGDTGPLHLAAALGTRVVGLYGPTNPARNGPYGQLDRCVSAWGTTRAINSIAVNDVLSTILSTVERVAG
jgi:lipopolysaccharide heptosyltransferase I